MCGNQQRARGKSNEPAIARTTSAKAKENLELGRRNKKIEKREHNAASERKEVKHETLAARGRVTSAI